MGSRRSQRSVYLVTTAIVASMVGGFALASMSLGGTNNSYQGSQTTTVSSLPGLNYSLTALSVLESNIASPCRPLSNACDVTSGTGLELCAGSYTGSLCTTGRFVEQVNLTTVKGMSFPVLSPSAVAVTVYVTGTPSSGPYSGVQGTYTGFTFYFSETGNPTTNQTISLDFEVGPVPGAVTSISVVATTVP